MNNFFFRIAKPYVVLWFSVVCFSLSITTVWAQQPLEIIDQQSAYAFNAWMHFTVQYRSPETIQEGFVLYQLPGEDQPRVYQGVLSDQSMEVDVVLTPENKPRPFTEMVYWYRFSSDHGKIYDSDHYSFTYEDNRYTWQVFEKLPFTLHWYNGDAQFISSILAAAEQGSRKAKELLPLSDLDPTSIWIYDNIADVQLLADQAGFTWQAGHMDPATGMILLSLAPEPQQSLEIQRQVPHEIGHLMLYQTLGAEKYARLPIWLIEGIASNVEIYSDPARNGLVELAQASNRLLPFYSLCQAFPQDGASARLAYAQSAAFINYLSSHYGSAGLNLLVDAYAETGDCMNASMPSFGKDLSGLESEWRASLIDKQDPLGWLEKIPWRAILSSGAIALLLFFGLRFFTRKGRQIDDR